MSIVEASSLAEDARVDAPFVLAAATRADPVDDDLAIAKLKRRAFSEKVEAQRVHRGGKRQVAHESAEQRDRWQIAGLPALEFRGCFRCEGRSERRNSGRVKIVFRHESFLRRIGYERYY